MKKGKQVLLWLMIQEKSSILEANWRIHCVRFCVQAPISTTVVGIWEKTFYGLRWLEIRELCNHLHNDRQIQIWIRFSILFRLSADCLIAAHNSTETCDCQNKGNNRYVDKYGFHQKLWWISWKVQNLKQADKLHCCHQTPKLFAPGSNLVQKGFNM